ncbi:hypothetical protein [Croceimicrobium sp.]|uniref:hypothetical protein n=1 Tax=Croceimicrobium sp. TaxID=2828340 RepID=UPI003BA8F7E2
MNKFVEKLLVLIESSGLEISLTLVLTLVVIVAATKPENFKILFGYFWHVLAIPFKYFRKKAIRFQIEGPLTKALKRISKELPV